MFLRAAHVAEAAGGRVILDQDAGIKHEPFDGGGALLAPWS